MIMRGVEPLGEATGNQSLGGIGLNIFCVISGFLITKSRMRNDGHSFFQSRALRIFPALFVAIPLMALVMGPMVSALPAKEYFSSGETWRFLGSALVFPLNPSLPGVFSNAPLVGQLYSLTAELGFYVFVGLLGKWKHYDKLLAIVIAAVFSAFLQFDYSTLPFSRLISVQVEDFTVFFFPARLGLICIFYLLAGSGIALIAPNPARLAKFVPILLAVWAGALLCTDRRAYDVAEMVLLPASIIGIGTASKLVARIPSFIGDISYGIYIYHFAAAELLLTWTVEGFRNRYAMVLSVVLSMIAAWLSYHLIEKRALALKQIRPFAPEQDDVFKRKSATLESYPTKTRPIAP
jgi:peptidoglycan/LPS O-acetylase OafA/YrhL